MVIYFKIKLLFFDNSQFPLTIQHPKFPWPTLRSYIPRQQGSIKEAGRKSNQLHSYFLLLWRPSAAMTHFAPWKFISWVQFPFNQWPTKWNYVAIFKFEMIRNGLKTCPFISQDSAVNCENRGSTTYQDFDREVGNGFVFLQPSAHGHIANRQFQIFPSEFFIYLFLPWCFSEWVNKFIFTNLVLSRPDWFL